MFLKLCLWSTVLLATAKGPLTSAHIEQLYLRHTRGTVLASRHEARSFSRIIWKESRNQVNSANKHSTAYGLGQLLKSTRKRYGDYKDASGQVKATIRYIIDRYGKPSRALIFHEKKGWY